MAEVGPEAVIFALGVVGQLVGLGLILEELDQDLDFAGGRFAAERFPEEAF
jgi:hypothetical protein